MIIFSIGNDNLEDLCQYEYSQLIKTVEDIGNEGILSDLGEIVGGSTPSRAVSDYYTNNGIAWLRPKDLSKDKSKFVSRGSIDLTEEGLKRCSSKLIPRGSILYTSRAPIGYIAISKNEICTGQGFKSIIPKEKWYTSFIYYYLKNNFELVNGMASGTIFMEISGTVMKNLPIIIPSEDLVKEFESYCQQIFRQQEQLEAENRKLIELRDYLLPKLMSGEIDVSGLLN